MRTVSTTYLYAPHIHKFLLNTKDSNSELNVNSRTISHPDMMTYFYGCLFSPKVTSHCHRNDQLCPQGLIVAFPLTVTPLYGKTPHNEFLNILSGVSQILNK